MKTHGLLVALLLALFAAAVPAQDGGESQPEKARPKPFPGPRSVWVAFYNRRRQAKAAEGAEREAYLTEAGSLFDLSGVNSADRDRTGRQAADKLKAYLDRVATGVNEFWWEPETLDEDRYSWDAPEKRGTITMTRGDWQVRTEANTVMTGTREDFLVSATLDAYEGETRVFSRSWSRRIPRDGN